MRNYKTEETNRTYNGWWYSCKKHSNNWYYNPACSNIYTKWAGCLIFKCKNITLTCNKKWSNKSDYRINYKSFKIIPCLHCYISVYYACNPWIITACSTVKRTHKTTKHCLYRNTDKNYSKRWETAFPWKTVNKQKCNHSSEECKKRCKEIKLWQKCCDKHSHKTCAWTYSYYTRVR